MQARVISGRTNASNYKVTPNYTKLHQITLIEIYVFVRFSPGDKGNESVDGRKSFY